MAVGPKFPISILTCFLTKRTSTHRREPFDIQNDSQAVHQISSQCVLHQLWPAVCPFAPIQLGNQCLSGGTSSQESTCQSRRCKRCGFDPWVGKILLSRKWQPTLIFFPGRFHGWRSLLGYSPWSCKDSDMTECAYTVTQSWSIHSQIKNTPRRVWDHTPKPSLLIFFFFL